MHCPPVNQGSSRGSSLAAQLGRIVILLLPAGLVLGSLIRQPNKANNALWISAACQIAACIACLLNHRNYRQPVNSVVMILYLAALSCFWISAASTEDWFVQLSQALLIIVPLLFFGLHIVRGSGAPAVRYARGLAQRLADRKDLPLNLDDCRSLPEVKALREALQIDAAPALELLENAPPAVQVAALAALEFRKDWRPGQAEKILKIAQTSKEPAVRAAGVAALANVDKVNVLEPLADFLRDPASEVRQAAREALLWDLNQRWRWLHLPIRRALGDPICFNDGPMKLNDGRLPPEAVNDYTAWVSEGGMIGQRAAQALSIHYGQILADSPKKSDINILHYLVADPHTSPILRLELAKLLQDYGELDISLLEKLLDSSNPAPLRLLAVKALLAKGPNGEALGALKDLARLPNREIALATAELIQGSLGIDLGLPAGEAPPALHTRQATEIARRVMAWASQRDSEKTPPVGNPALTERMTSAG
ncbi:MAG: HEAT repeat domain-containing protein [Gemmataceae bacterium]